MHPTMTSEDNPSCGDCLVPDIMEGESLEWSPQTSTHWYKGRQTEPDEQPAVPHALTYVIIYGNSPIDYGGLFGVRGM